MGRCLGVEKRRKQLRDGRNMKGSELEIRRSGLKRDLGKENRCSQIQSTGPMQSTRSGHFEKNSKNSRKNWKKYQEAYKIPKILKKIW